MFKVTITNPNTPQSPWSASFSTEIEANEWLTSQIGLPWRLPEREVSIEDDYAQEDVLEVIEEEVEGVMQQTKVRLRAQFTSEIVDISVQVAQQETNRAAKAFLEGSDYKVLRHIRQKALQQATTLTEEQYLALEQQRSDAAASIVE